MCVNLREAVLCVNCETITASKGSCETCGSRSLLNLEKILNRESAEDLLTQLQAEKVLARMVEKPMVTIDSGAGSYFSGGYYQTHKAIDVT